MPLFTPWSYQRTLLPTLVLLSFLAGCQSRPEPPAQGAVTSRAPGDTGPVTAAELFAKRCASCHGREGNGRGSRSGPPLNRRPLSHGQTLEAIQQSIRDGRPGGMPAFGHAFSAAQIEDLARYVSTLSDH